ncbi:asparaginase [Streptomyces litchfieldiae]|uniref:Asparaginase n=1 Tax=Streptomyces litchfieldiae TaxID=3075543 RepID=A0ABU2MP15_9ACTN|nr:asparaginase [Streptomyces sp. DSM 44938]MDT0343371.1 asparaginase [Streptomyces sp. DSM 44938]
MDPMTPVLAEVVRSGFVEGRHRGSLVVLAADGSVERALGDVTGPVFPRSSNKPMQAAAVLRTEVGLAGERLALAAGSHAGEDFHRELVARMLADAGLDEEALRCPADRPGYGAGPGPSSRLAMNCSGKHAAMLAACVARGWPLETYTSPSHPLQTLIRDTVEASTGEPVAHVGVDGCGAPLFAFSLTGLARAFRAYVLAEPDSAARRVADAMRAHPEYVAGTGRADTLLMRAVPGLLAKAGAEGVQAVALPDGRALALKIEDGNGRARVPVLAAALTALGVDASALPDEPVRGGGEPVGEIRAVI